MLKLIERLGPIDESTASDTLTLPFELRIRGRLKAESDSGRELGLFLDRGPVLRDGDGLKADNGEVVRVCAAIEPVVTARVSTGLPLARLAYHLGNRHVQLALGGGRAGRLGAFPPPTTSSKSWPSCWVPHSSTTTPPSTPNRARTTR